MTERLLDVRGLSIGFATERGESSAVRDLSFAIAPGEVLALVGESGSGKSATSLAILRLLPATARVRGEILFGGRDLLRLPEEEMRRHRGRDITMIFQEPMTALNPVMPIGKQIAEAVIVHQGVTRTELKDKVLEALEAVAIPDEAKRLGDYPHQFSGGQRQRILIAMALVNRPRLLIADEPTTALDVTVQAQILDLLEELRERYALAMLFISHDLAVVARVAHRIAILRHGQMLECGSREQICGSPRHAYTQALLGAVPTLETRRDAPLPTLVRDASLRGSGAALTEVAAGHWLRAVE